MKKNLFGSLLPVVMMLLAISCSNDEVKAPDLENITTLNMLNVENGATRLGNSDIYINDENNFTTNSCYLVELGISGEIGKVIAPSIGNGLVRKASVVEKCLYQAFDEESVMRFPSKTVATMVDAVYYLFYVESYIIKDIPNTTTSENVGAVVKYSAIYPDPLDLPGYGETVLDIIENHGVVEMSFPKDVEFAYDEDDRFEVETSGGRLKVTLVYTSGRGDYPIYVRRGNVFTEVIVRIS